MSGTVAVVYDDRPANVTGSSWPCSHPSSLPHDTCRRLGARGAPGARRWFEGLADRSEVSLRSSVDETLGEGWDVKPMVLHRLLGKGHDRVVWVDSDVLCTGDLIARLGCDTSGTLVGAEEYRWGQARGSLARTTGWGLEVGRQLAVT